MTNLIKTTLAACIALTLVFSACKRTEIKGRTEIKPDYNALAKQIGLSFYSSFSKDNSKFKTAGTGERKSLTDKPYCGQVIVTPVNNTVTAGDTTRLILGNSVFTYLCKNDSLNAYTFVDTTKVTENGTGFSNSYLSTQNYHAVYSYPFPSVKGTITAVNDVKKLGPNNVVTASYYFAAQYELDQIRVFVDANNQAAFFGQVFFKSQAVNKDANTGVDGNIQNLKGNIIFGNGILWIQFYGADGTIPARFTVNPKTGEVAKWLL